MQESKSVLIVEDELTTKKVICRALESAGFRTVSASNGKEALSLLNENPNFDLIITDIQMPIMDGRELLSNISLDENIRNIPVIVVSGTIDAESIQDLLIENSPSFFSKPLDMKGLVVCSKRLSAHKRI